MKFTKFFTLLSLVLLVGLTSCKKEPVNNIGPEVEEEVIPQTQTTNPLVFQLQANTSSSSAAAGLDLGCFSVDFPFDLDVDGTVVTISEEEDFSDSIFDNAVIIDFVYPLNVTLLDGTGETVEDAEELGELFAACVPDGGWSNDNFPAYLICDINSCYQLVYPVGLVDGDDNTYSAADEEEFIELIVEHPELYFDFPISLTDLDGNEVVANSDEELFALIAECQDNFDPGIDTTNYDFGPGQFGCYELVFPLNAIDVDGNEVELADEDAFNNAMLNGTIVTFAYPISLEDVDGNITVVNSDEELFLSLFACGTSMGLGHANLIGNSSVYGGTCYDLVYPFSATNMDGNSVTVEDDAAAMALLESMEFYIVDTPVQVQLIDTQDLVSVDSEEALFSVLFSCQ